jgi:hypothetical protein
MQGGLKKVIEISRNMRRHGLNCASVGLLAILGVWIFLNSAAIAQTGFSGLRGNITDKSGGVVAGAQVILTEPATGVRLRTAVSDGQGNFEFPNLIPGTYQLISEMKGFKAFIADGVVLDAGQIRRLDIRLAVGDVKQTVEVHAGEALINTEGGSITGEFDKAKVADAPVIDSYPFPIL